MTPLNGVSGAEFTEVQEERKTKEAKTVKTKNVPVGAESQETKTKQQQIAERKAQAEAFIQQAKTYGYDKDYSFSINNDGYVVITTKSKTTLGSIKSDFNIADGVMGQFNKLQGVYEPKEIGDRGVKSYDLADAAKGAQIVIPASMMSPDKPLKEKMSNAMTSAKEYVKSIPSRTNQYFADKADQKAKTEAAERRKSADEKFKKADNSGYNESYSYEVNEKGMIVITVKDNTTLGKIKKDFGVPDGVIGQFNNLEKDYEAREIGDTGITSFDLAKAKKGNKIVIPAEAFNPRERNAVQKFFGL